MKSSELEKLIEDLRKDVQEIKSNHLVHIATDISEIKTDLVWIKRFFFLVAGTSITAVAGAVFGLILK